VIDVSKPLVNQGLWKERVSFLEANLRGACWSRMLLNIKIKLLTLRTTTLALVHSTAEYRAPIWCRGAHTRLIDFVINDALRTVTGYLRPAPADNLPILAGIQPAELRRKGTTMSLTSRAVDPGHLLHSALTYPSYGNGRHLKSRHPFVPAAQHLISSSEDYNSREAICADSRWNAE